MRSSTKEALRMALRRRLEMRAVSSFRSGAGGSGNSTILRQQAPRAAADARKKSSANLRTEPTTSAAKEILSAHVSKSPSTGPKSLNTSQGRVSLSGPDLNSLQNDIEACAALRGIPTTLLNDGLSKTPQELEKKRAEIIEYFHNTFSLTESLHEMFTNSPAYYEKHEQLRHPPIFYLGHTASFYVNKLHLGKFITERIDPVLEMQMAVGVDEMSWDDLDSNSYVWPSGAEARDDPERATAFLQKVLDFRYEVRQLVDGMLKSQPMEWPIKHDSFWWIMMMGIEHERIHLETSSVIHRQANLTSVRHVETFPLCDRGRFHCDPESSAARSIPVNRLIPVPAGSTRLGRSWDDTKTYGWDNEFGHPRQVEVPAFAASEFLVSNKEFLDFVNEGGYKTQRYWTEEGWNWVSDMKPTAPRFWRSDSEGFYLRTLSHEVPMPWDWPVEVNNLEADAFCKYLSEKTGKTLRLPMEDEFMRIRDSVPTDLQDSAHGPAWGTASETPGNVNLAHWGSPCPVDTFKSPLGVYDVLGNVWQHSATHIDVLDGFRTHPLYDDFTTPTIGECHSRIMGGSFLSTGCNGATRDSRYGFRRHFYQHAGFRYIETDRPVVNSASPYESDRNLCDGFRFHFDAAPLGENFHDKLIDAVSRAFGASDLTGVRSMELGCGPGRSVIELAKLGVAEAHGADRTAKSFQFTAQRVLAEGGKLRWTNYLEGEHVAKRELSAEEMGASGAAAKAVQFFQMPDMSAIDTQKFSDYDLVVCAQPGALGSRDPTGLLRNVHRLLKPDGLLVLGTQYEWAVPAEALPAGAKGASTGEEVLKALLAEWFEPASEAVDIPFAKAETARKLECGTQHVTFWRRRAEAAPSAGAAVEASTEASTEASAAAGQAIYDDATTVGHYLDFHFGPGSDYPVACAARCVAAARELGVPLERALEVGGGPGRATIELSRDFGHVDGGDYAASFVDLAKGFVEGGELSWRVPVDRTSGTSEERRIRSTDLKVGSVSFTQMDAQDLPKELTDYNLICGFNLIDRLANPQAFLSSVRTRLRPGGLLVLSSPYTWLEDFTPKDNWLGGFKYGDNDGPETYVGLKEFLLSQGFEEALAPEDLWFRIDELGNGRKSQQTRAQLTFWRLK